MSTTYIPRNGGYLKNFKLQGDGDMIDTKQSVIKSGTFDKGKLNGDNCLCVKYSGAFANIRQGVYSDDKENGKIYEYVFAKTLWQEFLDKQEGIDSTRYTHIFKNGKWESTSETLSNKKIKGGFTYAGEKLTGFVFNEV